MPVIRTNSARLYYRIVGRGYPCLAMHGGLGLDHTCMSPFLDDLGDAFRIVYYDQRGNGRSSRGGATTLTFQQLVEDAEAVRIAALGTDKTAVIASSFGGFVALQYALSYPERISRLILVGTAARYSHFAETRAVIKRLGGSDAQVRVLAEPPPADDAGTEAKFRLLGPLYFHDSDPTLTELVFGRTTWGGRAAARSRVLSSAYDIRDRLREISVPTLIVVGRDDFITPVSQAQVLHEGIHGSRLAIFEGSGHFPYVEEPLAFAETVRTWMSET